MTNTWGRDSENRSLTTNMKLHSFKFELNKKTRSSITKGEIIFIF